MGTRLAAGAVRLATAIPAFALSRVIWPDPPGAPVPPPGLHPFLQMYGERETGFEPATRPWQ